MFHRTLLLRATRSIPSLHTPTTTPRALTTLSVSRTSHLHNTPHRRAASHTSPDLVRWMSSRSIADEKIEEITELFNTAQDEFEIAMEETTENTVYAEDDRKAAREEFDKLHKAYRDVVESSDAALAEEVKRRIGHRVRELEEGVKRMEELAMAHD